MSRLLKGLRVICFLLFNMYCAAHIPPFQSLENTGMNGISFKPCTIKRTREVINLFIELNSSRSIELSKRLLFLLLGSRLSLVCVDTITGKPIGLMFFYFNFEEAKERLVHEAFTGLLPEYRGKGIGTNLRRYALKHFAKVKWIKGVSSRVTVSNAASLYSNIKLGFKERERYFDKNLGVERLYLICDLTQYRNDS